MILQFLAALSAGIAAWCLALYLLRIISEIDLSEKAPVSLPRRIPILFRLVTPLLPLTRPFAARPAFAAWRETTAPRLWMAGYGEVFTPVDFIALRILMILLGVVVIFAGMGSRYFAGFVLLAFLVMLMPGMWLGQEIKKRHLSIMKALPNVLDLLTLSVESGRDLLSGLRDILSRRKIDPLGEELLFTFHEIQLGRKRTEALRDLTRRVRQGDLTSVINAIIQAEELGVSIAQILRIQGDMQRNKRFTLAEKLANESSVKILGPIMICILPAVFLILMGPFALQALRILK